MTKFDTNPSAANTMRDPDAIIVGAGPAGLACAACLRMAGLEAVVLEKAETVGSVWRRHYDRLHLHTDRNHSGLPGLAMPRAYPKYPSRKQVVAYLEAYAAHFAIVPVFGDAVTAIEREDDGWRVEAGRAWRAPTVIVATGTAGWPHRPLWPGLAGFRGDIVHSGDYRNPARYGGKRVLVVGFGNSGGEIALDLAEAGVDITIAVRGPIQILPRDLLGLPILTWAILYGRLPAGFVDWINAPILRLAVGRVDNLGLRLARKGPRRMVEEDGKVPLFDIGTLARIRDGSIKVSGAIERLTPDGVLFEGEAGPQPFDAIILATGFRPDLGTLLPNVEDVLDRRGLPLLTARATSAPGLYFCGQKASPTGQLREIGIEACKIAKLVQVRSELLSRVPA